MSSIEGGAKGAGETRFYFFDCSSFLRRYSSFSRIFASSPRSVGRYHDGTLHAFGKVVLARGVRILLVVGVAVVLPVAEVLHELRRRVADVERNGPRAVLGDEGARLVVRRVHGIRLRRDGEIDHALGERELAFGRAQALVDLRGVDRDFQRARIGEPDVLARHADHAAGEVARIDASVEHAYQPVERRVRVASANALVQRRDLVVVVLAALVEAPPGALRHGVHEVHVRAAPAFDARGLRHLLDEVERPPPVAVGELRDALRASLVASVPSASKPRSMSASRSADDRLSSTYTCARESSAPITSKDGFSVVAPMKVRSPDSTCGRNASCCALLKRCTSSTKMMVERPNCSRRGARAPPLRECP
jgi:hypothetical protein